MEQRVHILTKPKMADAFPCVHMDDQPLLEELKEWITGMWFQHRILLFP